mmetsp:Transcript_144025/g.203783  ORF Transcript_144025/g.203783 Transcript_144025/m.203783 type:complete len:183 (-) Transcript_144025:59-607(-)
MASPKRHKHGATKLLKIDFAKEFESRGLPLEDSSAERDAKELQKVASFFGMDGQDVHRLGQSEADAEPSNEDWEDDELLIEMETMTSRADSQSSRKQWLHRPVTPKELQKAKPPMPISINDFGSIFPRDSFRFPQESHYDYFHRRLPGEAPEHRKAMQWKTDIARKFHKYAGRRTQTIDRWM